MKNNLVVRMHCILTVIKVVCKKRHRQLKSFNKNSLPQRPSKNVFIGILAVFCTFSIGCKKDISSNSIANGEDIKSALNIPIERLDMFSDPFKICIFSFRQLVTLLRSNPAPVQAV